MFWLENRLVRLARRLWLPLALIILFLGLQAGPQIVNTARAAGTTPSAPIFLAPRSPSAAGNVYLPFIAGGSYPATQTQPALLGIYAPAWWGSQTDVTNYLINLDAWAGLSRSANKGHSLAGDFIDLEVSNPSSNVAGTLEVLWSNGYTDFINMNTSTRTAADIANGKADANITAWAQAYQSWVSLGNGRKAFLAPLEEMNGSWTMYGCDPTNFIAAYKHIQNIFAAQGVTRSQVWWVFAPNGWSSPCHAMQEYYPGDSYVDIIGYSAYNFGTSCGGTWDSPSTVFQWTQTIRSLWPTKPIFVAQTGSGPTGGDKDQWIRDAYAYLAQQNVRAVIYYNLNPAWQPCEWRVYTPNGSIRSQGYADAVSTSSFRYYPAGLSGWTPNP